MPMFPTKGIYIRSTCTVHYQVQMLFFNLRDRADGFFTSPSASPSSTHEEREPPKNLQGYRDRMHSFSLGLDL